MLKHILPIAEQFAPGEITQISQHGAGNINNTYLIATSGGPVKTFILQQINSAVFSNPQLIMENLQTVANHLHHKLDNDRARENWQIIDLLPARNDDHFLVDDQGSFWRGLSFVNNAQSHETIQNPEHGRQAGYALGKFQQLLSDLPANSLHPTIKNFHHTPSYLQHYEMISMQSRIPASSEINFCKKFITRRAAGAGALEKIKEQGLVPIRIIHGDPKISNIMLDLDTGQAVSMVDLDTVQPGLIHYDIGDCLRSCCNPDGEESCTPEDIRFDPDLGQLILHGYISEASNFLTENEYAYIYEAIRLIAFELGLRFFSDFLAGNLYFKVKDKEHNLRRAMVQFKLAESIEAQKSQISAIIKDVKKLNHRITGRGFRPSDR
ncbi:MAG: aminoglycoside phosphotransferase family protein [Proteobacteria bacterium]|nr:aminoglycoside phosphotransferase family protein [Pseudomonadota bacterium]MBU1714444.1 aminoglycoside phosphotransferase family protein [Pseudomonadota bacterium]